MQHNAGLNYYCPGLAVMVYPNHIPRPSGRSEASQARSVRVLAFRFRASEDKGCQYNAEKSVFVSRDLVSLRKAHKSGSLGLACMRPFMPKSQVLLGTVRKRSKTQKPGAPVVLTLMYLSAGWVEGRGRWWITEVLQGLA